MNSLTKRARMLREWRSWIPQVVKVIKKLLPDAEVYVIGSVAEGRAIAASDLDLLVVSQKVPDMARERARLIATIEERAELPLYHPIEFHLVKPAEKGSYLQKSKKYIRLA